MICRWLLNRPVPRPGKYPFCDRQGLHHRRPSTIRTSSSDVVFILIHTHMWAQILQMGDVSENFYQHLGK